MGSVNRWRIHATILGWKADPIRAGEQVFIKPEFQDAGDSKTVWIAVEDEDGGRVKIEAQLDMPINPTQVINVDMLEEFSQ